MTIDEFVDKLDLLYGVSDSPIAEERKSELSECLSSEADYLLVAADGNPNWDNIKVLHNRGYKVRPTETDGFGWLCAVITRPEHKTRVYFG